MSPTVWRSVAASGALGGVIAAREEAEMRPPSGYRRSPGGATSLVQGTPKEGPPSCGSLRRPEQVCDDALELRDEPLGDGEQHAVVDRAGSHARVDALD